MVRNCYSDGNLEFSFGFQKSERKGGSRQSCSPAVGLCGYQPSTHERLLVRVTDGSDSVRVPTESSPTLVPGRQISVPHAGRWWLDVRLSNSDPDARCVQGESTSGRVTVKGVSTNPTPAPRTPGPASGRQQAPTSAASAGPGRKAAVLTAQGSGAAEPSPSAITALNPATLVPPSGVTIRCRKHPPDRAEAPRWLS